MLKRDHRQRLQRLGRRESISAQIEYNTLIKNNTQAKLL
jgi:hypothetical protein